MRRLLLAFTLAASAFAQTHPQVLLDAGTLAKMRAKATANDADWQAVKATCDTYTTLIVYNPPLDPSGSSSEVYSGNTGTVSGVGIGIGNGIDYEGSSRLDAARYLGACYQSLITTNPAQARVYSNKAREVIGSLTSPAITVQKSGGTPYYIATRAKSGQAYGSFYWTGAETGIAAGDTVTISGALGCTNLNGSWTVASVTSGGTGYNTIAFNGLPVANADCQNRTWAFTRDNGYGFRNYGVAMALLYDWFYQELQPSEIAALNVATQMYADAVNRHGYGKTGMPESNYASNNTGAYMACYGAWANDSNDAKGVASLAYATWQTTLLGAGGQIDYYNRWMSGGGYGEGLQAYGYNAIARLAEAVMTAKNAGIDLQNTYSYNFVEDQAKYFLMAAKPDRLSMDEQEYVYFSQVPNPTKIPYYTLYVLEWAAARQGSTYAPYLQSLVQYVEANSGQTADHLDRFLYYDASAPVADQTTLPKSYRAWGGNFATARSDWSSNAVVLHFQGGPSTGAAGNGKTQFDSGAFAIWNGPNPFVVFGMGEASRSYDILTVSNDGGLYYERAYYFNRKNSIFAADRPGSNFSRIDGLMSTPGPPGLVYTATSYPTKIDLAEDTGNHAYFRSVGLQAPQPYSAVDAKFHKVAWTRQIVFLRPKVFVVYDATSVKYADDDRMMNWVFGRDLAQQADPATGEHLFYSTRNSGATFKGALTTVLPLNSSVSIMDHGPMSLTGSGASATAVAGTPLHFLYRVEQRPSALDHTDDTWLNVFDAATSAGAVEAVTALSGTNVDAVQLSSSGVVGFAKGSTPTLPMSYGFTGTPNHVIAGLTPGASYHVSMGAGPVATISAATGSGDTTASAAGVLTFDSTGVPEAVAPTIVTTSLANGAVSAAYSQTLLATGTAPIRWSISSGTLPSWASLNASTGALTGTPDVAGTTYFAVQATNAAGTASQPLSITVTSRIVPPTVTTVALPNGAIGVPYSTALSASGTPPITWAVVSGALPGWATLNSLTGEITGTPDNKGTTAFIVEASNQAGASDKVLSIVVPGLTPSIAGRVSISGHGLLVQH